MSRSTYAPTVEYIGTGAVSAYDFTFKIEELAQLLVVEYDDSGVETQRVRGTDAVYLSSVTFDAVEGGGTVNLAANLTTDYKLIILLANDAPTQPNEFREKFSFTLKSFEMALDWLGGAIMRLSYLAQRSVRLNDYTDLADFDPTLPIEVTDATSQTIITKSDGTGFEIGPSASAISGAEASATAAAASEAAAAASEAAAAASEAAAAASVTATQLAKYTTGYADLTAAALTNDISLYTLPAKTVVETIVIKHSELFAASGLSSLLISVGIVGDLTLLIDSFDVLQTVDDQEFWTLDLTYIGSFASTTDLRISAVAVGANLDTLSAGSVDVWLKTKGME